MQRVRRGRLLRAAERAHGIGTSLRAGFSVVLLATVLNPGKSSQPRREQRLCELALWVLSALFAISMSPSLHVQPIGLDDQALIAHFSGASFTQVWAFDQLGHLRPIKNLYFWCLANVPQLLFGLRTLNIVVAIACTWLVRRSSLQLGASQLVAASAAALWLWNPTTVSGVAWLSASNYLFALLGALCYVLLLAPAADSGAAATGRVGVRWGLAHVALSIAVLSHELAILTPAWLVFRQLRTAAVGGTSPFARVRSICAGALVVAVLPAGLRIFQAAPQLRYRSDLPAPQLVASAAYNLEQNLRLWLWPHGSFGVLLSQTSALSPAVAVSSWLGALLCTWLLWRLSRRADLVALALAWLLLFLLPLVNVIPIGNTPVAQHYLIIPGIALSWLVARAIAALAPLPLGAALVGALLLSWQPAFRQSLHAYASTVGLYEATLANYPQNLEARVNLIAAYEDAGQHDKARELLASSLQLAPDHPGLLKNQLAMLFRARRFPEALETLDQHTELVRADPELNLRRALVLQQLGRAQEAEAVFEHIFAAPAAPELHLIAGLQLASLRAQQRRLPEAQALLRRLHAQFPDNGDVELTLRLIEEALTPAR